MRWRSSLGSFSISSNLLKVSLSKEAFKPSPSSASVRAHEGEIADVSIDPTTGAIVVVDEDGKETAYPEEKDEATGERKSVKIVDSSGDTWIVDKNGNVSKGVGAGDNAPNEISETDSMLFVQKELIKEVLQYYKGEINFLLENKEKGPLEIETLKKMFEFPNCLPEDEEKLEAVLDKIEKYLEDPEALLNLINEDDMNMTKVKELTARLTGKKPPYAKGLSESEWDRLLEMICPYLIVDEELPELVTIEPITDDQFAAGIDNDMLSIEYSIKTTEKFPLLYAKLEVYKNDGTLAFVKSEGLEIGEEKKFNWNGRVNQNVSDGEEIYIRSDESPFTAKIIASITNDFSDPFKAEAQASVNPFVDDFLDNYEVAQHIEASSNIAKFEYYQQLSAFLYDEISSNQIDERITRDFANALDYLGDKINERFFLGRKVMVHDKYWEYLQTIESNLGGSYVSHPDYTMGGFNIRFQRGSTKKVSNHAYGMALDVKAARNPYLEKGQLYFLQLLIDFKLFQNPSNPEDLKAAHDKLIGFGYQQANITSMKTGFEHLNHNSLKSENVEVLLNEVLGSYRSAASAFVQLVNLNNNLRNDVHFFNQKTPQEIAEIKRQLFEELPAAADALLETVRSIKSTQEINQLYDLYKEGYQNAFLLDKHNAHQNAEMLTLLSRLKGLFGFEAAVASLKLACVQPKNGDYTHWITNVDISPPQSIPELTTYQSVSRFIESRKRDYKEVFGNTSSYSGIISVLSSSNSLNLAQNGFMLMSAEFAREFLDTGNGDIGWGGNWKGLKDFMHLEYIADDKF